MQGVLVSLEADNFIPASEKTLAGTVGLDSNALFNGNSMNAGVTIWNLVIGAAGSFSLNAFIAYAYLYANSVSPGILFTNNVITTTVNGTWSANVQGQSFTGLSYYDDEAAATLAGVPTGILYQTTGFSLIPQLQVRGIVLVKQ